MTDEMNGEQTISKPVAIGLLVRQTLANFEELIQSMAVGWGQFGPTGTLNDLLAEMTTEMVRCVISTVVISSGLKPRGMSTGLCKALADMHTQRLRRVSWAASLLETIEQNPDLFRPEKEQLMIPLDRVIRLEEAIRAAAKYAGFQQSETETVWYCLGWLEQMARRAVCDLGLHGHEKEATDDM